MSGAVTAGKLLRIEPPADRDSEGSATDTTHVATPPPMVAQQRGATPERGKPAASSARGDSMHQEDVSPGNGTAVHFPETPPKDAGLQGRAADGSPPPAFSMKDDGHVKVVVRARPLLDYEIHAQSPMVAASSGKGDIIIQAGNQHSARKFAYDRAYGINSTQRAIYEECVMGMVRAACEGYNATVLAYGQSGSGKTFTMGTGHERSKLTEDNMGILPRAARDLYQIKEEVKEQSQGREELHFTCSFVEIYNDDLRDLLSRDPTFDRGGRELQIREEHGSVFVQGCRELETSAMDDMMRVFEMGLENRSTGTTALNEHSSRSHAVFTVGIRKLDHAIGVAVDSKFHLVDLAGSERLKKTQARGQRMKEGMNINLGLLSLGNVISALSEVKKPGERQRHVPYRDHKLTRILQDSLGGNSKTLFIACISSAEINLDETLNTLKYAERAARVQNRPRRNLAEMMGDEAFLVQVKTLEAFLADKEMRVGAIPDLDAFGPEVLWAMLVRLKNTSQGKLPGSGESEQKLLAEVARLRREVSHLRLELLTQREELGVRLAAYEALLKIREDIMNCMLTDVRAMVAAKQVPQSCLTRMEMRAREGATSVEKWLEDFMAFAAQEKAATGVAPQSVHLGGKAVERAMSLSAQLRRAPLITRVGNPSPSMRRGLRGALSADLTHSIDWTLLSHSMAGTPGGLHKHGWRISLPKDDGGEEPRASSNAATPAVERMLMRQRTTGSTMLRSRAATAHGDGSGGESDHEASGAMASIQEPPVSKFTIRGHGISLYSEDEDNDAGEPSVGDGPAQSHGDGAVSDARSAIVHSSRGVSDGVLEESDGGSAPEEDELSAFRGRASPSKLEMVVGAGRIRRTSNNVVSVGTPLSGSSKASAPSPTRLPRSATSAAEPGKGEPATPPGPPARGESEQGTVSEGGGSRWMQVYSKIFEASREHRDNDKAARHTLESGASRPTLLERIKQLAARDADAEASDGSATAASRWQTARAALVKKTASNRAKALLEKLAGPRINAFDREEVASQSPQGGAQRPRHEITGASERLLRVLTGTVVGGEEGSARSSFVESDGGSPDRLPRLSSLPGIIEHEQEGLSRHVTPAQIFCDSSEDDGSQRGVPALPPTPPPLPGDEERAPAAAAAMHLAEIDPGHVHAVPVPVATPVAPPAASPVQATIDRFERTRSNGPSRAGEAPGGDAAPSQHSTSSGDRWSPMRASRSRARGTPSRRTGSGKALLREKSGSPRSGVMPAWAPDQARAYYGMAPMERLASLQPQPSDAAVQLLKQDGGGSELQPATALLAAKPSMPEDAIIHEFFKQFGAPSRGDSREDILAALRATSGDDGSQDDGASQSLRGRSDADDVATVPARQGSRSDADGAGAAEKASEGGVPPVPDFRNLVEHVMEVKFGVRNVEESTVTQLLKRTRERMRAVEDEVAHKAQEQGRDSTGAESVGEGGAPRGGRGWRKVRRAVDEGVDKMQELQERAEKLNNSLRKMNLRSTIQPMESTVDSLFRQTLDEDALVEPDSAPPMLPPAPSLGGVTIASALSNASKTLEAWSPPARGVSGTYRMRALDKSIAEGSSPASQSKGVAAQEGKGAGAAGGGLGKTVGFADMLVASDSARMRGRGASAVGLGSASERPERTPPSASARPIAELTRAYEESSHHSSRKKAGDSLRKDSAKGTPSPGRIQWEKPKKGGSPFGALGGSSVTAGDSGRKASSRFKD
ncbi:unnamed protein product [Pedinophyceae sp. YPF-701]|nr:unnamed protein product [Pedinophyceae sp. YPF-701]